MSESTSADESNGGAEEIRTPDPLVANQMLYQLSYSPTDIPDGINDMRTSNLFYDASLRSARQLRLNPIVLVE